MARRSHLVTVKINAGETDMAMTNAFRGLVEAMNMGHCNSLQKLEIGTWNESAEPNIQSLFQVQYRLFTHACNLSPPIDMHIPYYVHSLTLLHTPTRPCALRAPPSTAFLSRPASRVPVLSS